MNTKEYIESGILENYVAGSASDQEHREVECMSKIYPEIRQELDLLNNTMVSLASVVSKPAPVGLKNDILSAIADIEPDELIETRETSVKEEAKVVSLNNDPTVKSSGFQRMALAASVIGLILFGTMWLRTSNELGETQSAIAEMKSQQDQLKNQVADLQTESSEKQEILEVVSDPYNKRIAMAGLEISPESRSLVFWNEKTNVVYIDPGTLPQAPSDKQFQLWAIVDGVPVSMGVFDSGSDSSIQRLINVESPQAFAVTLEQLGGSESPTLEQMYVLGSLSS